MQRTDAVPPRPDPPADAGRRRSYQRGPHLFQRGPYWYLRLPGATPPERALHTRDAGVADRLFREFLDGRRGAAALGAGAAPGELGLGEIYKRWVAAPHGWTFRTREGCEYRGAAFVGAMAALGVTLPSQLAADKLDTWIRAREATQARATINRDLTVARRMLTWAAHPDQGYCNPTPLERRKNLREPKRRPRRVLPDPRQVARVVTALRAAGEEGAALLVATAAATGLRLEELRRLRPGHVTATAVRVEPEAGPAATAWATKGYEAREIQLAPVALAVVRRFVAWRASAKGGKGKPVGLADCWIAERLDAACGAAKVAPAFRMHDLRRAFATEAVGAGVPIRVVARWLGHKDIATTEGYVGGYASDAAVRPPTPAAIRSATKGRAEPRGTKRLDGDPADVPRAGKRSKGRPRRKSNPRPSV